VKPRKVKGLDPDASLADMAERIIRVRLDELVSVAPTALQPEELDALHDMRIAAKRLRYVLEVTGPCFGSYAATAAKRARELQDLIGEIHDCDVMLPVLEALVVQMRAEDAAALRILAGDDDDVPARLGAGAPHRAEYRGLEVLSAHVQARRSLLFEGFAHRWTQLERQGFARRLQRALSERPGASTDPQVEEVRAA
jgi:CHAD domain-containing protein